MDRIVGVQIGGRIGRFRFFQSALLLPALFIGQPGGGLYLLGLSGGSAVGLYGLELFLCPLLEKKVIELILSDRVGVLAAALFQNLPLGPIPVLQSSQVGADGFVLNLDGLLLLLAL